MTKEKKGMLKREGTKKMKTDEDRMGEEYPGRASRGGST